MFDQYKINELVKCAADPIYFIRNYIKILDPIKGVIALNLYDFQEEMIREFHENKKVCCLSSRQNGKTICAIAFILWKTLFEIDNVIAILGTSDAQAKDILSRILFSYENLPDYLRAGITINNKHIVCFDNGSSISAFSARSLNSMRGRHISLLYIDELSYMKNGEEIITSFLPVLVGSSCIVSSSLNTTDTAFTKLYKDALSKNNSFKPINFPWNRHPDRDAAWADKYREMIGAQSFKSEMACEFM